jgi:hypothetical protein
VLWQWQQQCKTDYSDAKLISYCKTQLSRKYNNMWD